MIVVSLTLSSWYCNQLYCWHLVPLQSLMWLTRIDQKVGCFLCILAGSLVGINCCCHSLWYNRKISSLLLLLAIQCSTLKIDHHIINFVVVVIDFIAGALCLCICCLLPCNAIWKIWLVVAWCNLALPYCNQPLSSLLLAIQHKNMLVVVILVIDSITKFDCCMGHFIIIPLQLLARNVQIIHCLCLLLCYRYKNIVVIDDCNTT